MSPSYVRVVTSIFPEVVWNEKNDCEKLATLIVILLQVVHTEVVVDNVELGDDFDVVTVDEVLEIILVDVVLLEKSSHVNVGSVTYGVEVEFSTFSSS